jgi:hypothetical protein
LATGKCGVAAKSFWRSTKFREEVKCGNKLNPAFFRNKEAAYRNEYRRSSLKVPLSLI